MTLTVKGNNTNVINADRLDDAYKADFTQAATIVADFSMTLNNAIFPEGISRFYTGTGGSPDGGFCHCTTVKRLGTRGYQIAIPDTVNNDAYIRNQKTDGTAWEAWTRLNAIKRHEYASYTSLASSTNVIPYDSSIPQITEGEQILSIALSAAAATSILKIKVQVTLSCSVTSVGTIALFKDTAAGAIMASTHILTTAPRTFTLEHVVAAGDTSAHTYKIRVGAATGTMYINRDSAGVNSGVYSCRMTVEEIN